MISINRKSLLESGVHFGEKQQKMNPKMKKYVYGVRGGVHIIDLEKTIKMLKVACEEIKNISSSGGKVLFVGTKKQASESIKRAATSCNSYFINSRWLGGTLTNHSTIRRSVNKLIKMEKEDVENFSKKDLSLHNKKKEKLFKNFDGIRDMIVLPNALVVASVNEDAIAIEEAHKLGIPVFAISDTDVNPDKVDYIIPANDDAIRGINLMLQHLSNSVNLGVKGELEKIEKTDSKEDSSDKQTNEEVKEQKVVESEVEDGANKKA